MRVLFTSGPIENDTGFDTPCGLIPRRLNPVSTFFFINVLNNNRKEKIKLIVKYFSLNGCERKKRPILVADTVAFPRINEVIGGTPVNRFFRFEIQIIAEGKSLRSINNLLFSAWGKNKNGLLVPVHRFLRKDFKPFILCK